MNKTTSDITEEDIQKAINYLKTNKSPEEATRENAIKLLQGMQVTAHMIAHDEVEKEMESKTYKSFLMGAKSIKDEELSSLNIGIVRDGYPDVRMLIIPEESIEQYKALIRSKLDAGYWNEFVGEDLIYFIFKMPDGEIKEYTYDENSRLEIAALCTKLNNDPIEKTSNLLDYLAENEFYTDVVTNFRGKHQL